ncbi:MAG: endolytic transglycosylase MltG [Candidatus Promineifilaceae bacterium]
MGRRSDPFQRHIGLGGVLVRLGLLFAVLTICATAGFLLYARWSLLQGGPSLPGSNPALEPAERLYLGAYLMARQEELGKPAGQGDSVVQFVVLPGERADQIAANLAASEVIDDTSLFLNYLRYTGLDSRLEAGSFELSPQWRVAEIAAALSDAVAEEVVLRFVEGWRSGEMADYLARHAPAQIEAAAFEAIVTGRAPFERSSYEFLGNLAADASLEGYLFPDTYRLGLEADAAELVTALLDNFGRRVTPAMRQEFGLQGLSVREAVILASIVEREAAVAAERPLMAGVFLNRMRQGMRLEADPTVQYALGYQQVAGEWWKRPLTVEDLQFDSPYNTYLYAGLPPGPIANPGLASLQAVAAPAETDFLFFVTDCTAETPGAHIFAATFEEHQANVARCR